VLLLEEPFVGLSLVEIGQISEAIKKLKAQFTVAIVEHKTSKVMDLVDHLARQTRVRWSAAATS
jgi:branched-chain amino acid transport system ATP-binding protein